MSSSTMTGRPGTGYVNATMWAERLAARTRGQDGSIGAILALANATGVINFSGGFPDPSLFPAEQLADITSRLLHDDAAVALQYSASEGIASTREAIADRLELTQGVRPADTELMVTSGGIDALTLIGKSMLDPGDVAAVESPTYLGAIIGFTSFAAQVRSVPTDDDGLDADALAALLAGGLDPKVLYVIPDHQNPTGRSLSESRRHQLVEVCRRHHVLLVEDVAYRELSFAGHELPSLWSLGPDVVVQIGTFSKTFFPGIRLGWAAGPAAVIEQLVVAKQNSDQCAGALGQRMLETFLREGRYDDHVAAARALYARRGAAMAAALERHFAGRGTWTVPHGGFFSWLHLPGVDTTVLAANARAVDVAFVPGAGFFSDQPDTSHLRLSFSRIDEADIEQGIARLAGVVASSGDPR
ncbi:MAG: PLP-dependent aminotransferase family protein [Nocardioidaceae bacterium]